MGESMKSWICFGILMGIGIVFAVASAFVCAGIIMFILDHLEMTVLFVFALWVMNFGWRTKDDLFIDE